jgi:tRNA threonylcarbamoyladenosine biosynthesis protein TsaE
MLQLSSTSTEETKAIGYKLAEYLNKGDVIILSGDLGAGKTVFVSGILSFFNKDDEVSSPTFTIANEYSLTPNLKMFHLDVYRLNSEAEFTAIGGEEFFYEGLCIIEWGEKILNLLPTQYLKIEIIKHEDIKDIRYINITPIGEKYENIIKEVFEE